ncbi:TPA: D-Ala-D-Ala carboxypeptidase VanY-M [Enterococcus faecium]|uniref:VanY-A/VanY-F/VanY-M family D-Ala-D-Ala carboxypeptidase n=1 Tax=Enterococcus faecium TaxID=1352 RepID=A0A6P1VA04_ENTFC|nr:D-Ala-D-Ala carboxypeptidase VanY-M [Enterococcus faecium]HAQ1583259.1 VanY-A/VanY-F/VanY-M family D-Ala-D-Ala carboxypeptidase [Enterococcus faecium Efm-HS0661]HER4210040.1 VanY-A/VanY-F/VanY-M family D-Ala-D-Ala carboxypeptidase [Streptococcus pyogenes]MBW4137619.1 VanY-A/VanY-F/VanY-M family D-Ala-D-Ala carboxypeptidase [Enterococcus faecium]MBY3608521.1 VanY-A/VanY-F/VanY-M family D-Ala-D-Ala carboxypeptidase [Enterococcus faecium]MBY3641598.1 VanY-A/VanY-F/VanY-M family D-Ala-D-Ala car
MGIFFLLCLSLVFTIKESYFQDKAEVQRYEENNKEYLDDSETSESFQTIKITKEMVFQGNLLLVNNEYPVLEESIKTDVVNLFKHDELTKGYELLNREIYLSEKVAREFSEMVDAAEKEGVRHFSINSGFRNFDEQNALYQEMGSDYALPAGYSEHNLGLALDIGSTQMEMSEAPEGKWLEDNAWEYGFILRYPMDKTAITGIQYEPWHFRYVGLPHSAIIEEKNFALEEYLDFLKEQKSISGTIHGENYEISYYPITEKTDIEMPANLHYEISGNNMDGVIVTVYR